MSSVEGYSPARNWRKNAERYRLLGQKCPSCGVPSFGEQAVCIECKKPYQTIKAIPIPAEPIKK